jgi:hypothetical protein
MTDILKVLQPLGPWFLFAVSVIYIILDKVPSALNNTRDSKSRKSVDLRKAVDELLDEKFAEVDNRLKDNETILTLTLRVKSLENDLELIINFLLTQASEETRSRFEVFRPRLVFTDAEAAEPSD